MIKSMTSFASTEVTHDDLTVSSEIRTYNSRHLDIALRIPPEYFDMERRMKNLVSEKLARGRVEIRLNMVDDSDQAYQFEIDEAEADAYYTALNQLKSRFALKSEISIDHFAGVGKIIRRVQHKRDLESDWTLIEECLVKALDETEIMREKEGAFILKDLTKRLEFIEKSIIAMENRASDILSFYQEKLVNRISVLTGDSVDIDPSRIAQEIAFLADKSDISEEIVRIKSHIEQFNAIMDAQEPAGRKLNFLLQEFNRECNTLSSKVQSTDLSHGVVTVKAELEKIREQVQNVE